MTKLPEDFEAYTRALMGEELYAVFEKGMSQEPPTSIRLNPFKTAACTDIVASLVQRGEAQPIGWCTEGCHLASRPNFTFDPHLHTGAYYVQEASSMFVTHILRQLVTHPALMLDLCAAPGGKTTAARTALPQGSVLFSNEPMKLRASILTENVQKFGHPDMVVTNNFPKDYNKSGLIFDVILVDVPCSGEGMFRKDESAISEWSTQNVEKCWQLQRSIIEDIWPCLAEGGLLIYSTCTFNAHENEENVNWIAHTLGADLVAINAPAEWNIAGSLVDQGPMYRFIPGKTQGEGLFVAVLRKHGEATNALDHWAAPTDKENRKRRSARSVSKTPAVPNDLAAQWLDGNFVTTEHKDALVAIPSAWHALYDMARKSLHILHAGVGLGTRKGKDIVPDASLALSVCRKSGAFEQIELDYDTAIQYLRKEAITLPANSPRGFVTVGYGGQPLGFVKNIGNRANNLYPQEWKIKSTHLPAQPVDVLHVSPANTIGHGD